MEKRGGPAECFQDTGHMAWGLAFGSSAPHNLGHPEPQQSTCLSISRTSYKKQISGSRPAHSSECGAWGGLYFLKLPGDCTLRVESWRLIALHLLFPLAGSPPSFFSTSLNFCSHVSVQCLLLCMPPSARFAFPSPSVISTNTHLAFPTCQPLPYGSHVLR